MKKIIFLVFLAGFSCTLLAQDSIQNSGNLQVHSGAVISGFGHFVNTSGSQLVNSGDLYLRRNLVNDELSMTAGTGTLYLNGSSQQVISGNQPFKTYNLSTDNAAGILLNNDLSVAGAHTFTAGLISTSATPNYLVYESGAGYSGDNDSRHVNGWVKKNGSEDFSFPVGDGVYERKAALSALSISSSFTCRYYTPTFNIYNLMSPLVQVKENEYWQINKLSGGTARITLNWDHSRVPMNHVLVSEILVAYYTAAQWNSLGGTASGNVLTTGSITSNPVSNFGSHTLGYTNFPLPLTLISFTGIRSNAVSRLSWVTEHESGVEHFVAERSFDGVHFTTVGQVQARNTGTQEKYLLTDPVAFSGNAYYRLKITDQDGKISYSGIILLNEATGSSILTVINPVHTGIQLLSQPGTNDQFSYRIYSMTGQTLQSGKVTLSGSGNTMIPLTQYFSPGVYQLDLIDGEKKLTRKLLIQ